MSQVLTFTGTTDGDELIGISGSSKIGSEFNRARENAAGISIIIPALDDMDGATVLIKARPTGSEVTPEPLKKVDGSTSFAVGDQEKFIFGNNMDYFVNVSGGSGSIDFHIYQADIN